MNKITTLVFVRRGDEILLGMKKRGFGEGRWDGFGGKVEPGETLLEAAKRELLEESGLVASKLHEVAQTYFDYETIPDKIHNTVYLCDDFSGEPIETDEMRPRWFNINELPYDQMWTDEKFWVPSLFVGKQLEVTFHYKDLIEIKDFSIIERVTNQPIVN
jgi:8-oxo-dGTP diphosphatase/2-hydroxy-dATP diphosphatase